MKRETIEEVLNKLIGNISPSGCLAKDSDRKANLKVYLEIWDNMHSKIDDIVYYNKDAHENSIKDMVKMCNDQLDRVGIKES